MGNTYGAAATLATVREASPALQVKAAFVLNLTA
jgi:hypothetical protein